MPNLCLLIKRWGLTSLLLTNCKIMHIFFRCPTLVHHNCAPPPPMIFVYYSCLILLWLCLAVQCGGCGGKDLLQCKYLNRWVCFISGCSDVRIAVFFSDLLIVWVGQSEQQNRSVDKCFLNAMDIAAFSWFKPWGSGRDVHIEGFYWWPNDLPGFRGEKIW